MAGRDEELAEFTALSDKVARKTATEGERARWRLLRAKLASVVKPAGAPSGGKQREHARTPRKLKIAYAPVGDLPVTFTDDVGGGGVRLRSPRHLEPGTELVMRLELAGAGDPHPVVAVGRVAWSRRDGGHFTVGVELPWLRPEERERIEALAHAPVPSG